MNLVEQQKSRKKLKAGDIFVYQLKQEKGLYRFGKIIKTDAVIGGFSDSTANLLYFYDVVSNSKEIIPALNNDKLLIAPLGTNNLPWRRGYFENVGFEDVTKENTLKVHCFRDSTLRKTKYYNEYSQEIKKSRGLIGDFGLHSFLTIDDELSTRLGYPISGEESET